MLIASRFSLTLSNTTGAYFFISFVAVAILVGIWAGCCLKLTARVVSEQDMVDVTKVPGAGEHSA